MNTTSLTCTCNGKLTTASILKLRHREAQHFDAIPEGHKSNQNSKVAL